LEDKKKKKKKKAEKPKKKPSLREREKREVETRDTTSGATLHVSHTPKDLKLFGIER
jgi:hypothetical protein